MISRYNAAPRPEPETGSHWERPPKQEGNQLNLIVLVSDTFRADNLAAYGSEWVEAPNLNPFAEPSLVFEDCYPEGMPTIPTRRQMYTGRRIVPRHDYDQHENVQLPGWHQLFYEGVTLAETLREANYLTALIADLSHLTKAGRNFDLGFTDFEWIRGQEIDFYAQAPRIRPDFTDLYPADYIAHNELARQFGREPKEGFTDFLNQYVANRKRWLNMAIRRAADRLQSHRLAQRESRPGSLLSSGRSV